MHDEHCHIYIEFVDDFFARYCAGEHTRARAFSRCPLVSLYLLLVTII